MEKKEFIMSKKKVVWVRCSLPRSLQGYAKGVIEAVSGKFSDSNRFYILDIQSGKWFMYENISGVYVRTGSGQTPDADVSSADYCGRVRDMINITGSLWVLVWDSDDLPDGVTDPGWTVIGLYLKKVINGKFSLKGETKSWIVIWKNSRGGISWQDVKP